MILAYYITRSYYLQDEVLEERNKQKVKESFAKEFIFAHQVDAYSPEYGLHVKKPVDIGNGMLMSMRKKTGESLFDLINRDITAPCLAFLESLMLAIDFVQATRVCNKAGVLHRDIKTENIIVEPSVGFGRLCDYGLSTDLSQPDANIAGSLPYLAPEFWTSSNCISSEATDLYSMGRVLFLLFRGSTLER